MSRKHENRKSRLFQYFARAYIRRRLKREFSSLWASGLDPLRELLKEGPVVVAANHVAFWDPLLLVYLDEVLESDAYCLMDSENLDSLPFFSWVGALKLDRKSNARAYRDLRKATELLDRPGRMLIIFPHGGQRPAHLPLDFKSGVVHLATLSGAPVVPLGIRYDFSEQPKAEVHLSLGRAMRHKSCATRVENQAFLKQIERAVRTELKRVDRHLAGGGGFELLFGKTKYQAEQTRLPTGTSALRLLAGRVAR